MSFRTLTPRRTAWAWSAAMLLSATACHHSTPRSETAASGQDARQAPSTGSPAISIKPQGESTAAPAATGDFRTEAMAAGRVSPRDASCPQHCAHAWSQRKPASAKPSGDADLFADACLRSCVGQIVERSGHQCYGLFGGFDEAGMALYLERTTIEGAVPCLAEAGDTRPEAVHARELFDIEQRTPATKAAFALEIRAWLSGSPQDLSIAVDARRKANDSSEWRAVVQAFSAWQADDVTGPAVLECMERTQTLCLVAMGEE